MLSNAFHQLNWMPQGERLFPPPELAERGCFLISCGIHCAQDAPSYDFDNRTRSNFCVLQITLEGEGCFAEVPAGKTVLLPPGRAFLIEAPGATRYWLPKGGAWKLAYATFSGAAAFYHCSRIRAQVGPVFDLSAADAVLETIAGICALCSREGNDFFLASARVYAALMALRSWAAGDAAGDAGAIAPALKLIESAYANSRLGVADLAAACGYSRYHFTRLFRQATGSSPQIYLIKMRLQQALQMLSGSELPPKQIALACGINDYAYFCHLFKRHYGITPGSIRR